MEVGELEGSLQGAFQVQACRQLLCSLQASGFQSVLEELQDAAVCVCLLSELLSFQIIQVIWISLQEIGGYLN